MYAWLLPAVKAILPHVGTIVSATLPVFKNRKIDETAPTEEALLQRQITELQTVATQNAAHIKDLAAQLERMVSTLEQGVIAHERRYRRMSMLAWMAIALSLTSLGLFLGGK